MLDRYDDCGRIVAGFSLNIKRNPLLGLGRNKYYYLNALFDENNGHFARP
jgi:hypothetical protein